MENIGKQLYILRKKKNLTLRDLETLSGVKFVRIGRFENNLEKPSLAVIEKLERALQVKFDEIEYVSKKILELYQSFVEALLYESNDLDTYESNIINNEEVYSINYQYSKIMLIKYIIRVHKNDFVNIDKDEKDLLRLLDEKSDPLQLFYEYKGVRLFLQGYKDEAVVFLELALTMSNNPKQNTMIYYHISMVNMSRNKYVEALKYAGLAKGGFVEFASFKRILYIDGQIGSIYSQMRRFDLAIDKYKTCLISCGTLDLPFSKKAIFLRNLSWIYIKSGNYVEPMTYLEEAEKLEPDNVHLKMYKIWCNYKLRKFNTARGLIDKYSDLCKVKTHMKRYKLFSELIYNVGNKPTLALIDLAIDTYNEFVAKRDFELMNFYIDIVIDLLKQRDDNQKLIQYLEMKIRINDEINK